jgi:signal transduction histidine kinase
MDMTSTNGRSPISESQALPWNADTWLRRLLAPAEKRGLLIVPVGIIATIVWWPAGHIAYPWLALPLFVATSVAAVGSLLPWTRLTERQQTAVAATYILLGALLLPLMRSDVPGCFFPFSASTVAGLRLASRRAAVGVAMAGAVTAALWIWLAGHLAPGVDTWPWWMGLTVGLPVYGGLARRYRVDALRNARLAAEEAQRAAKSEAREAALEERGRIAREIHDVLGHSLSGVALQLEMAEALRQRGRDEEATAAVRRARALAVDSIGETRRAVHALRTDSLPLVDVLRQMADLNGAGFEVTGTEEPLAAETAHTIVRVAQEALTNAARHAPGATRTMRLGFADDRTALTVTNGAATAAPRAELADGTGMGLIGMRERVALRNGTLRAGPDGGGWTVGLEIPR